VVARLSWAPWSWAKLGASAGQSEDGEEGSYLCIGKNLRRDDLVGAKGLAGVDERCQNLSRLPALACWFQLSVDVTAR
jgi:hypothetical protein